MDGDVEQVTVLRQALREVPKSGEVWCEVSQPTPAYLLREPQEPSKTENENFRKLSFGGYVARD